MGGAQVFFCFTQSVASTRWMLQDEMHISNTECDNCLIGTMIFCQYLSCLCDIAACLSGSDEIRLLADAIDIAAQLIWCTCAASSPPPAGLLWGGVACQTVLCS